MAEIARLIWLTSGGRAQPPDRLVSPVVAHLSPYFTAAVTTDVGLDYNDAAELAYDAIVATIRELTEMSTLERPVHRRRPKASGFDEQIPPTSQRP